MEEININEPTATEDTGNANAPTVEGTVKSFDMGRRYGFIRQEGGREVFVHQEAILGQGTIAAGDRVSFQVTEAPRGPRAVSVRRL